MELAGAADLPRSPDNLLAGIGLVRAGKDILWRLPRWRMEEGWSALAPAVHRKVVVYVAGAARAFQAKAKRKMVRAVAQER